MARRGSNRGRGGGRGTKVLTFPAFPSGGIIQPFAEQSDNRKPAYSDPYVQLQQQQHAHYPQQHHQQQTSFNDRGAGRYAEDYFPQNLQQYQEVPPKAETSASQIQRTFPADGVSTENAGPKPQTKDMSWEKVRKMNLYRLRTLPLDMVHVLEEGRKRRLRVAPLEGQQRKIEAVESLENQDFVAKCLDPLDLRCDCCEVDFIGPNKLREMLNHIQTPQHFTIFRTRMLQDPLYAYRMNKTSVIPPQPNPQNPSNSKKKNKNQPSTDQSDAPTGQTKRNQNSVAPTGEDGPKASKKMKHADVPEEYRPMADWLACYVCNITCSSLSIYESHAVGKRHQRILSLAPQHVQDLPWGPYLIDGKPTIDTTLGAVKISVQAGQNKRVGGEQPQLMDAPWLDKVRGFVASKIANKMEI
ncbi:uncharacterized protein LOC111268702 isoform X1 [Varroa jacobsoni]|uniref:C2H2-type domain-containing protein n=1 Tax=Varroa destructor TaxID=109461 RepID=A0A7M7JIR1_VARDE|nr:uncharacterized protein LOC111246740 isoform X2 [Varroa destructor]XP_022703578.1 uncharacterized protein LOC111268702 isoform X1 [Varroa jacobsoni]